MDRTTVPSEGVTVTRVDIVRVSDTTGLVTVMLVSVAAVRVDAVVTVRFAPMICGPAEALGNCDTVRVPADALTAVTKVPAGMSGPLIGMPTKALVKTDVGEMDEMVW